MGFKDDYQQFIHIDDRAKVIATFFDASKRQ